MSSSNGPFLVGGTGRSGTTIVARLLARHAALTNVPEWRFLIDPDGILDFHHGAGLWSPYLFDRRVKRLDELLRAIGGQARSDAFALEIEQYFGARKLSGRYARVTAQGIDAAFGRRARELVEELTEFRFDGRWEGMYRLERPEMRYGPPDLARVTDMLRRFLENLMADVCREQGAEHYLEKNTWNILFLDRILELLPNARLVHVYRDPRDVVASFTRQEWMPSDPAQSATIYRDLIRRWWRIRECVPEGAYLEIGLESLIADPESTLRHVCEYLGIVWDPAMLQVALSDGNVGRWRTQFSADTAAEVTGIVGEVIEAYGYG